MRSAALLLLALQWLWSAALASARSDSESAEDEETVAEIEVVQYRGNGVVPNNSTLLLHGHFAGAGMRVAAEGKLLQFHPLWLCNTSEDEQQDYGFVSMVKLERPDRDPHPCLSLFNKAKFAIQRGATAVIFDVTDDASAAGQLKQNQEDLLPCPVILIQGHDATQLMKVINTNGEAIVRIHVKSDRLGRPAYDVGILMTLIVAFSVVVMILAVRIKCKQNRTRNSLQQQTINAISQLATRRYQSRCQAQSHEHQNSLDSQSSNVSEPVCAICLEEFADGQDLRIISCFHEFHKECIDPWLLQHRTCPLCMYNIIEGSASIPQLEPQDQANPAAQLNQRIHLLRRYPGHAHLHRPDTAIPSRPSRLNNPRTPGMQIAPPGHYFVAPEVYRAGFNTMRYVATRPQQSSNLHRCNYRHADGQGVFYRHHRPFTVRKGPPWPDQVLHHPCLHKPPCWPQHLSAYNAPLSSHHLTPNCAPDHSQITSNHDNHSYSGDSFGINCSVRSGYLADSPGSDSSSGPCHCSSSDSTLDCTDISNHCTYGSQSTFRSSLSSEYDPLVYCGAGGETMKSSTFEVERPRSMDSVNGPLEDNVFSHTHYHHHRHHHYGDADPSPEGVQCMNPGWNSAEKQDSTQSEEFMNDKRHCQPEAEFSCQSQCAAHPVQCPCLEQHLLLPTGLCLPETSLKTMDVERRQSEAVCAKPDQVPSENKSNRTSNRRRRRRRKRSFQMNQPMVYFHQDYNALEDCRVHIHYGNRGRQGHLPNVQPSVPIPLILNNGASNEWSFPFCECPSSLCQQRLCQVGSEPQLAEEQHMNNNEPRHTFQESCTEVYCDGVQDESFHCQTIPHNPGSESNVGEIGEEAV
ncbi:E3 ubiquitin-protein ligase RNF43 isoform X1 [Hemiscyllium ocellatum]|uniref:E3 ubiquitin-protein ligase RNF43 isoform X1 n=1 Tax=Hemiscyllium ocellatum TaxID=170820 RepID=UPI00296698EB|nr:E3 ubiquitin-protein ligase RNF43 isoform X1 [Hemiscyllium ocellatum]